MPIMVSAGAIANVRLDQNGCGLIINLPNIPTMNNIIAATRHIIETCRLITSVISLLTSDQILRTQLAFIPTLVMSQR